jgi:hypothetical protein
MANAWELKGEQEENYDLAAMFVSAVATANQTVHQLQRKLRKAGTTLSSVEFGDTGIIVSRLPYRAQIRKICGEMRLLYLLSKLLQFLLFWKQV